MNKREFIEKAKSLNFPIGSYFIFGSGPLCVREIRESNDLDILVTEELFDELFQKSEWKHFISKMGSLSLKSEDSSIEIFKDFPTIEDVSAVIEEADIIEGLSFINLEKLIDVKKFMGREKDFDDIRLIEKFLKK